MKPAMNDWNNTIVNIIGTMKTGKDGKILFTENQFGKFTATLKVYEETAWSVLERKTTYVFVDSLRPKDVEAFKTLENCGEINGNTRICIAGHLIRTPGKPGMNDLFNIKTLSIRPATKDEKNTVDFEEALTKDEWQVIRKEKFSGAAVSAEAPSAPAAPTAPF